MHLPDGFLDVKTALLSTGAAAAGVGLALRQARETLEPRRVPLLGLAAAFVFAAQMLNFPIPGGTSGHLMGGVLAAVLLGPAAATLVITCVLIVQCLMFADGGLMALGANAFNMAIVSVWGGYSVFRLCRPLIHAQERSIVFASAFAAWFGTVLGAISCAGQLAFSGTANWGVAFPAMANVHMIIGIGEGLTTGLITMAVLRARPDLVAEGPSAQAQPGSNGGRYFVAFGLLLAAGLAVFVAPFACPWPDGLEMVARRLGFEASAVSSAIAAPVADYNLPFVGSVTVATGLAGLIGTLVAFGAAYCLAWVAVPVLSAGKKNARPSN
jgi:cobalt/nickel transport system permease protein